MGWSLELIHDGSMTVKVDVGSDGATWGGGQYKLTQELEKSTWGHMGWRLELIDDGWMTVKLDMGSDGVRGGHMGWWKI